MEGGNSGTSSMSGKTTRANLRNFWNNASIISVAVVICLNEGAVGESRVLVPEARVFDLFVQHPTVTNYLQNLGKTVSDVSQNSFSTFFKFLNQAADKLHQNQLSLNNLSKDATSQQNLLESRKVALKTTREEIFQSFKSQPPLDAALRAHIEQLGLLRAGIKTRKTLEQEHMERIQERNASLDAQLAGCSDRLGAREEVVRNFISTEAETARKNDRLPARRFCDNSILVPLLPNQMKNSYPL